MATNIGKTLISPNQFFEGWRVKGPDDPDYIQFLGACGKEVDKMIAQFAKGNYTSHTPEQSLHEWKDKGTYQIHHE